MQIHWNPDLEKRLCEIPRSHPWTGSSEDGRANYVNFRVAPEAVREVLEDYKPYEDRAAIQRFYELLLWANGPDSVVETNDCLLRVIGEPSPAIRGHVTFFFRDLVLNCRASSVAWLGQQLEHGLRAADPGFAGAVFDYARWPAHFRTLHDENGAPRAGNLINLRFAANGGNEGEAFENLDRAFGALHVALRDLTDRAAALPLELRHHADGVAEEVGSAEIS